MGDHVEGKGAAVSETLYCGYGSNVKSVVINPLVTELNTI
jgi:hypothetical protein